MAKVKAQAADLLQSPVPESRVFGRLAKAASVTTLGVVGPFTKVSLGGARFAFVRTADLETASGPAAGAIAFEDAMVHAPPLIEIQPPALATRDGQIPIKVSAKDDSRLLDAYVFVGSRKVFYRSNRNGSDPKQMAFDASLPLRPGVNVVSVFARENPDTIGRRTFIVRKDGANGQLLPTPKTDDDLSESGAMED
jgi:carboxyl-terminal processing protease